MGKTILLKVDGFETEIEAPILTVKPLRVLLVGKDVKPLTCTNTELARILFLRPVVERIKEIQIHLKEG